MERLKGSIIRRNSKEKLITITYINPEGKQKNLKLKIQSPELWEIAKNCNRDIEIEYEEAAPYPVVKRIIGKMSFVIYGFNSRIKEALKDMGVFSPYTREVLLESIVPAASLTGSELDIIILAIILALLVMFSIYYFLIIPILILILSIFTLGEAIRMVKRKRFTIDIDSSDDQLCRKIREIVRIVLLNKGVVDKVIKTCMTPEYEKYLNEFKSIHIRFWRGMSLQGLAIILLGILYGLTKIYKLIPGDIFYFTEIIFAIIFAIGFLLSMWSGLSRRFTETPLKIKYLE